MQRLGCFLRTRAAWASVMIVTALSPAARADAILDALTFGAAESETRHGLSAEHSATCAGALGDPTRQLLPLSPPSWEGGRVSFTMRVDPEQPNYFTIRLWGSDLNENRLILFCEGRQVGYRHLGDVDVLDTPNGAPACLGRFYYNTSPLPLQLTKGRTRLRCEIRSTGRIWGYGVNFEQYQKPMTGPTRGLYSVYTHTGGYFQPPADEKQGPPDPAAPPLRTAPGAKVFDKLTQRVNHAVTSLLTNKRPLNQHQLWFLSRAYHVPWTPAYHQEHSLRKVVEGLDALYVAFRQNPLIARKEPSMYNPEWFGLGPAAFAVVRLAAPLAPLLDQEVSGAAGVTRRLGWSEMFVACRDWQREHRRHYTNQSMIIDTYGIYLPNRGVAALTPSRALPERQALRYLYEAVGLEPWLGSENSGLPEKPLGDDYLQLTARGLTKELGFVGYYGEVLDWMSAMYDATRPAPGAPGDARLKAQIVKAARARAVFRYPTLDDQGCRAMRAETVVGWRDADHYPGDVTYGQRATRDASALDAAAATLDPALVGAAQQMCADRQFFSTVERQMREGSLRATAGLLTIPDDYATLLAQPRCEAVLPMAAGQPDFVFADEEAGVLAVKHGSEMFYASLYWRARYAVNFLARVHYLTPRYDRIAIVRQATLFEPSGLGYTQPDWINLPAQGGGVKYPGNLHSAHAGEKLPIARVPAAVKFQPGTENVYAGRGDFYILRYGPFLVGMNCSKEKTFELTTPPDIPQARDLVSQQSVPGGKLVRVAPRSTVVLYLGEGP